MDFSARYGKLNAAQKQAVDTIDGPVMVIAGPGTGKTELLSMRTAAILQKTDTLAENILCLTFTDSGANAMRERLMQIIGPQAYRVAVHTFHSFGSEVINQNGEFFYHGADFRPADELSCYELLRSIFDELEYSNPLASKMNGEYTHLGDTLSTISELKKSGLTSDELLLVLDANDHVIDVVEPLLANIFANRLSKTTVDQLAPLIESIRKASEAIPLPTIVPLARVLADSLETAVRDAQDSNSTKPITSWRTSWLKKNEVGEFVLKSRERGTKLRAVSYVYYQYLARMQEAQLYDFDDMILRVVHAMEVFPELRYNLQEKYQYIMVDEFQDTNMAQMRILYDLTSSEVNNGRPNILVVGDDDQAIYSFQGADVGNINGFRELYEQTKIITLTDNYRSSDIILSHARDVIMLGSNRLENFIDDLDKTLTPRYKATSTTLDLVELPTANDERQWLVDTIATSIQSGTPASSIAVLARRHHEIVALLPYFAHANVKVNYERRDNVLDLEVIKIVEHIATILVALFEKRHDDVEALLPELLAHPAFGIAPLDIWKLSTNAHQNHQKWMEIMETTPHFKPLHAWLVIQSQALGHMPLEQMLDLIIGIPENQRQVKASDSQSLGLNGTLVSESFPLNVPAENVSLKPDVTESHDHIFISPLYNYFFSPAKLADTPDMYLTYLEALRTIRSKLREYQPSVTPTLQSFLQFIRLHRQLGSTITGIRPHSERIDDAINLMTVHKSKGLEFDSVYIIGAIDGAWGERVRTRNRLINYPENLPLAPSGDNLDERLRLFFVAMTRARAHLTITYSTSSDTGKNTLRASFLSGQEWQVSLPKLPSTIDSLTRSAELTWYQPILQPPREDMRALLAPSLENYKLSSTHLNNFLDVTRGGPQMFLMNNLLRFPQAMSPSAAYGLAMHATLQRAHAHLSATTKLRPAEDILHDFEENLRARNLSDKEFQTYLQKGSDTLSKFLGAKYAAFRPDQKAEVNFSGQNVYLEEAHLTGSLDLIDIHESTVVVTDYKTGKALRNWTGKTDYEKIKLHKYRHQLMFYNLLVTHSRDYNKYTFEKGILQFVEPTSSGEIIALEAQFSSEELEHFKQLVMAVWRHIVKLDLSDTSHYEPTYKGMLTFENDLLAS